MNAQEEFERLAGIHATPRRRPVWPRSLALCAAGFGFGFLGFLAGYFEGDASGVIRGREKAYHEDKYLRSLERRERDQAIDVLRCEIEMKKTLLRSMETARREN